MLICLKTLFLPPTISASAFFNSSLALRIVVGCVDVVVVGVVATVVGNVVVAGDSVGEIQSSGQ